MISSGGPTSGQINHKASERGSGIHLLDLDARLTQRLLESDSQTRFSETLGRSTPVPDVINRGDAVEVTVWEAPPAVLFGTTSTGAGGNLVFNSAVSVPAKLPVQIVDSSGRLNIPFVGYVSAAGQSPQMVATEVRRRLVGRAHEPQVMVSIAQNANQTVTILGEVAQSGRIPLTSRGERLLDVLALAGGVRQPVNKTTIRVTRKNATQAMPLDSILRDPSQNIVLRPDDVVTAFFQPYSFTALGATGQNNEINFEGTGITLAQALGRMGGLQDNRANVKGVFIFRFEKSSVIDPSVAAARTDTQSVAPVPVVYRVDMTDPSTFFLAQRFPIKDKDIVYVSNAPTADLQKFLGIIANVVLPIASAQVLLNNNN